MECERRPGAVLRAGFPGNATEIQGIVLGFQDWDASRGWCRTKCCNAGRTFRFVSKSLERMTTPKFRETLLSWLFSVPREEFLLSSIKVTREIVLGPLFNLMNFAQVER